MPEQFLSPMWLSYLREWGEVTVHEAGNEEIHETIGIDEGAWARNSHKLLQSFTTLALQNEDFQPREGGVQFL